ncbi:DoxX family protein [Carboxylicivirga sp. RSCT41]|uniref:DoxX family protein n=1 Tax=Carboxylicivirga agarovorans TaxID=3417570 RepID=UPI003D32CFB2
MKITNYLKTALRIVLGLALCYAGTGHLFWLRQEFTAQVPHWVPLSTDLVVVLSGIVEILLGLSLILLPKFKQYTGIMTALFFIAIFPGNISQYINEIDAFGLNSDQARLSRLFFQPLLVVWAIWSTNAWQKIKNK